MTNMSQRPFREFEQPQTETVAASAARQRWSDLLGKVFREETRVIVEKSGIPIAALISAEDFTRLTLLEQERSERFRALDESWKAFEDVPLESVDQEVAQAVEAARRESGRTTSGA
jgi:prevent-host-death family protein